jgi:CRISPR-associated endoribonuclease Cas6
MKNSDRKISVKIMTPISFKSNGSYINIPDLRLIYNSLLRRFNEFSEQSFIPMETIDQLVDASDLAYRLRSTFYHLEGVRIKAFTGSFTVYLYGTPQIIQLANMLFRFAEYSGIGIKTTLGMGAVKLEKGEISG